MFPCPECKKLLVLENKDPDGLVICPQCGERLLIELFPALINPEKEIKAQSVETGEESSCYYHSDKIAMETCDHCGRFLCELCSISLDNHKLCPSCMAKGKGPISKGPSLNSHSLHDSIALVVAGSSVILGPFGIITALVSIFLIFRNYKKDLGLIPRMKWRFWLAGIFASIYILGMITMFISMGNID